MRADRLAPEQSEQYIDTPAALRDFCDRIRQSPWIALDTEFIREKTYYPQLCLVQVASEAQVACIDPLALDDLEPLLDIVFDPAIVKVLHSAHQDLEIFYHLRAAVPSPVFDTQIAATLLGYGEQVGYATLVKGLLDIELDKSQTRTDWSHRPLAPAQLAYAADDVRYLRDVYRWQRAELESQGRLDWLDEDFAELCAPGKYQAQAPEMWRRLKGAQHLRGVQLAVLRALAAWREERAIAANRPRRWILGDEVLLELARHLPGTLDRLERIRGLEPGFLRRQGETLLALIASARNTPAEQWPSAQPVRHTLDPAQEALVDAMTALVRWRGAEKGVSLQMLASRRDLESLLLGDADVPLLHGWRGALVGREVQALLRGELRIEVRRGHLCIVAA